MLDIQFIRDNPEQFDQAMGRRKLGALSAEILTIDQKWRAKQTSLQELQSQRNALSKQVGEVKRTGGNADEIMAQVAAIKDQMDGLESESQALQDQRDTMLVGLPNMMHADVPDGTDEEDNKQERAHGTVPKFSFTPKAHYDLGEELGMMDFNRATQLAGSRFVVLRGQLARLERALAQFMLNTHISEFGYEEVAPPYLVNDQTLFGTGQLPKFADQQFQTTNGYWLIPTAEVPLTNLVADQILSEEELPLRLTACTPCFRSEAGAAGKDTRGMLRQHQFSKVELVSITHPEKSWAEHDRMTDAAETILKRLGLAFRTMILCSGDTGFGAMKTYDLEVWLPGQDRYREISSCSNCGDFQARRMKARFKAEGDKKAQFVHTLNGSGVAVGRALIAVMENYQQEDGSIAVPDVLKPYTGFDVIEIDRKKAA